ncbi:lipoyl(octanoyl) transferase LipB [Candidatus Purcelliella pentastirinorum]|uniref:Octanoyltransferase n=1 Tax=Candidatus Purcelliella pentastirinorum TaxID=472834 RepID=A0AAX3N7V8_9ENTR|nr:lipoyl(octanoyl) transferase LipB [Candidatus Purcelliella pentastirinorum]WDI78717.1 lipoyl(octanoyl) transferase LipB [Candidatus Purcelliella pentastirinorum]WDR80672.1 lipoyl(octanoyl) transferase LipB [Candidatus Purcelliella pentastirinorum]
MKKKNNRLYENIIIKQLGLNHWLDIFKKMQEFTNKRDYKTLDEIWLVEHYPIYTNGISGINKNNIKNINNIPVLLSDRGGKITYHAPGQQIVYMLINLKRRQLNVCKLINIINNIVIQTLFHFSILAEINTNIPGIYVKKKKICSFALKIKNGYTYHGFALNVSINLRPFNNIHPCGNKHIKMTKMQTYKKNIKFNDVKKILIKKIIKNFNIKN